MANKQRSRSAQAIRLVENRLYQKKKEYERAKVEKLERQNRDCTSGYSFHPDISISQPTPRQDILKAQYSSQWHYLHMDSLNKSKRKKQDSFADEIELNRSPEEFTFHPDTSKSNRKRAKSGLKRQMKNDLIA